jgi:predicted PhzF superfamily epimerase YddE/YHI9
MGRPSLLFLRSEEKGGSIEVRVGGKVILVAKCELLEFASAKILK